MPLLFKILFSTNFKKNNINGDGMRVYEIIEECLMKMNYTDDFDKFNLSQEQEMLVKELICALDISYREIVCEYFPLINEEKVYFSQNNFNPFFTSRDMLRPISLTKDGQK